MYKCGSSWQVNGIQELCQIKLFEGSSFWGGWLHMLSAVYMLHVSHSIQRLICVKYDHSLPCDDNWELSGITRLLDMVSGMI